MAIVDRAFVYRGRMKLSSRDLRLVRSGKKTCSVRLGTAGVATESLELTDGKESIRVHVLEVETGRVFHELSDRDARADGLSSLETLEKDLRRFYGEIDPEQPMTIIKFAFMQPQADSDTSPNRSGAQEQLWSEDH